MGPRSTRCRCIQKTPDCQPDDGYDPVLVCDNTNGAVDLHCSYSHTVGTAYSTSMSEQMSVSVGVKAEMSADFFELFRLNLLV